MCQRWDCFCLIFLKHLLHEVLLDELFSHFCLPLKHVPQVGKTLQSMISVVCAVLALHAHSECPVLTTEE